MKDKDAQETPKDAPSDMQNFHTDARNDPNDALKTPKRHPK